MKCPNCGAEMEEGKLYCEHCGEDIHIVPDFEPEVEYNMEQTLSDIAKEMEPKPAEEEEPVHSESQDWDELPESHVSQHPFRWKFIVLVLVLLVVAVGMYRFWDFLFPLSFRRLSGKVRQRLCFIRGI